MKKAFSLIELCFVIVILGVILSVAKFYPKNDERIFLAARQILNDLAYTRTIALSQSAFRSDSLAVATKDEWFKSRWQLYFIRSKSATNNEQTYTIFLDKNGDGNANIGKTLLNLDREIAVDVINPNKIMNSGQSGVIAKDDIKASARFNIERHFGVNLVEFKGACSGSTKVIFDEQGRLYSPLANAIKPFEKTIFKKSSSCIIRLKNTQNQHACIVIDALTGMAHLPKFSAKNEQFVEFKGKMVECSKL